MFTFKEISVFFCCKLHFVTYALILLKQHYVVMYKLCSNLPFYYSHVFLTHCPMMNDVINWTSNLCPRAAGGPHSTTTSLDVNASTRLILLVFINNTTHREISILWNIVHTHTDNIHTYTILYRANSIKVLTDDHTRCKNLLMEAGN